MTKRVPPYPPEVRARAVRLVLDQQGEHASQWMAIHAMPEQAGGPGPRARRGGVIEITFGCGTRVCLRGEVAPETLRQVIELLR